MPITGAARAHRIATALRIQANGELRKELRKAVQAAVRPFGRAVKADVVTQHAVPTGFGPTLARALTIVASTSMREGVEVTIRIAAKGQTRLRDVAAMNVGLLGHPTYGNRKAWVTQAVRGGFVDRPRNDLEGKVGEDLERVVDRVARKVEGT